MTPSNFEQELLEMTNRARLDPQGEFDVFIRDAASATGVQDNISSALSYFGVDVEAFRDQLADLQAQAPLAWNGALADAARTHNTLMIETDTQSHQLPGEAGIGSRITDAGYTGWSSVSENIYAYGQDMLYTHAGFYIDWGYDDVDISNGAVRSNFQSLGDGIQDAAGHRKAILSSRLTEIGISVQAEGNTRTAVGPYVVTQDLGNRFDYKPQLLGVVIRDADGDDFYDAGEGLGDVLVTVRDAAGGTAGETVATTTTWASGGYQVELAAGRYEVSFTGGGLEGTVTKSVTMGRANQKLDALAAEAVVAVVEEPPVPDNTISGDARGNILQGSDAGEMLQGMAGNDWLTPGTGNDTVNGGDGVDMASFSDHTQAIIVDLGAGTVRSGVDTNQITHVENVTGSIYSDFFTGDAGDNWFRALGGYDWFISSAGADTYDGSNGRDMVTYIYADAGVTVDLGAQRGLGGDAATHRYIDVERVTGSIFDDIFYGSDGADEFRGAGGADVFYDSGARDRYDGGTGLDTVSYALSSGGVSASLLAGSGGPDRDLYTSIENLIGSNRDDMLSGDQGRNVLRGGHGNDTLLGMGGNDYLEGGGGDDALIGGDGYDVALYRNAASQYSISTVGDITTVSHITDGVDTLTEIEALRFADGFDYL